MAGLGDAYGEGRYFSYKDIPGHPIGIHGSMWQQFVSQNYPLVSNTLQTQNPGMGKKEIHRLTLQRLSDRYNRPIELPDSIEKYDMAAYRRSLAKPRKSKKSKMLALEAPPMGGGYYRGGAASLTLPPTIGGGFGFY